MKGNEIAPNKGSRKARMRVGRGGTTAGRGDKGQKSRSGGRKGPGFEGGQTPWYRKLPKWRGFKNPFRTEYQTVTLGNLDTFDNGTTITPELLVEKRILRNLNSPIKVLANGSLSKNLTVQLHGATAKAREAIEKAGGKVEVI